MRKNLANFSILIVFISGLALYAWYDVNGSEELIENILKEYPGIDTSVGINGRVTTIYCPPEVRCGGGLVTFIELDNAKKISIHAHRDVKDSLRVDQVLTIGGRIVVNAGSDTLSIFTVSTEQKPIRFVLDKTSN